MNVIDYLHETLNVNVANLSGSIDVIVIRQPDGTLRGSPFRVRFGKLKCFRSLEKKVTVIVNGKETSLMMKLSSTGEAYFNKPPELPIEKPHPPEKKEEEKKKPEIRKEEKEENIKPPEKKSLFGKLLSFFRLSSSEKKTEIPSETSMPPAGPESSPEEELGLIRQESEKCQEDDVEVELSLCAHRIYHNSLLHYRQSSFKIIIRIHNSTWKGTEQNNFQCKEDM